MKVGRSHLCLGNSFIRSVDSLFVIFNFWFTQNVRVDKRLCPIFDNQILNLIKLLMSFDIIVYITLKIFIVIYIVIVMIFFKSPQHHLRSGAFQ